MTDLHLHIDAIDTLMFRDGRPFNQSDAGASEAVSVFPPYPPTLVGAVRALLWQRVLGGKWDKDKLGDGTNWQNGATLGPLKFGPPLILRNGEPVFPMPLHIVKDKNGELSRLKPVPVRDCDLGLVKLPVPEDQSLEGIKTMDDHWVSKSGMEKILKGGEPDIGDCISKSDLWRSEPRVGIGIDKDSRITSDGQLYMASHVRLCDDVSLAVRLRGWKARVPDSLMPLAGEHRMAGIKTAAEVGLPENVTDGETHCLIALSPVVPDNEGKIKGMPENKIVSACLGKPIPIGGWDSQGKKPIPLRRCWPAGSVWFVKGEPPSELGQATEWGFGQILIGNGRRGI